MPLEEEYKSLNVAALTHVPQSKEWFLERLHEDSGAVLQKDDQYKNPIFELAAYAKSSECSNTLKELLKAGISLHLPFGTSKESILSIAIKHLNPLTLELILDLDKNILQYEKEYLSNILADLIQESSELKGKILVTANSFDQLQLSNIDKMISILEKNGIIPAFDKSYNQKPKAPVVEKNTTNSRFSLRRKLPASSGKDTVNDAQFMPNIQEESDNPLFQPEDHNKKNNL